MFGAREKKHVPISENRRASDTLSHDLTVSCVSSTNPIFLSLSFSLCLSLSLSLSVSLSLSLSFSLSKNKQIGP